MIVNYVKSFFRSKMIIYVPKSNMATGLLASIITTWRHLVSLSIVINILCCDV